jgi:hypothetical protein
MSAPANDFIAGCLLIKSPWQDISFMYRRFTPYPLFPIKFSFFHSFTGYPSAFTG